MLSTDPLDFLLGPDGDFVVTEDGLGTVSGAEGVGQLCAIAAKLVLGEWFLDTGQGVDWFTFFQERGSEAKASASLRAKWADTPGVSEVLSVKIVVDAVSRRAQVVGSVRTEFGDVEVTASVGGSSG